MEIMNKTFIVLSIMLAFSLQGCLSKAISLGENKTYCEEHGCDYSDAGVCKDPFFVLNNKQGVKQAAYKNIEGFSTKGDLNAK